jgi:hypothetical protein
MHARACRLLTHALAHCTHTGCTKCTGADNLATKSISKYGIAVNPEQAFDGPVISCMYKTGCVCKCAVQYARTHTRAHTHAHTHTRTHARTRTHIPRGHTHTHTHTHTTWTHTHTHTHTHTRSPTVRRLFPQLKCPTNATPCWSGKHPCSWNPWGDIEPSVNGGVPQAANLTAHVEQVRNRR